MATGEGKTLSGAIAAAGLCARGPARARRHHQRLPGQPRRRMDGPAAGSDGADRRLGHRGVDRRRAPRRIQVRRHLCLDQRDRVRRAARPAGHRRRRPGVAEPRRGADRRGRLGARRRGAGAAGARGHVAPGTAEARNHPAGRRIGRRRRLRHRFGQPQRPPHRDRRAEARSQTRRHRPLLRGARRHHPDRGERRAARPRPAAPRCALHRPRRRRASDQRQPRPHRAAAALARRPAGSRRSQRGHRDHRDRRGAGHHHRAGADQPVSHGVRDDRHRVGRRGAAAAVLQARGFADTAERSQHPRGRGGPRLHHRRRQERRDRRPHRRGAQDQASRSWSAPATSPNPRSCTSGWSRRACPRSC